MSTLSVDERLFGFFVGIWFRRSRMMFIFLLIEWHLGFKGNLRVTKCRARHRSFYLGVCKSLHLGAIKLVYLTNLYCW